MGVELGLWHGTYQNQTQTWVRWWDLEGNLLLIGNERAELEKQHAESEKQRAESEKQRAESEKQRAEQAEFALVEERALRQQQERKLNAIAERLRSLGIDLESSELSE
jgi:sRNA-binding protein